jgi:PKHD-type hydroxylase
MTNDAGQIQTITKFWRWENGLSPELCDLLLKDRAELEEKSAAVGNGSGDVNKSLRNSAVCWAPINHWVEGILYSFGIYACESAGWGFQLGRPEQIQLTAYDKDGFYGWHEDWSPFEPNPTIRKVSVVALLSDPSEFEGGEFQFEDGVTMDMKRGTVFAFPSFLRHQVTPVTTGKRYSAVCWVRGPRTL